MSDFCEFSCLSIDQGWAIAGLSTASSGVLASRAVVQEGQKFQMDRAFTTEDVASYVSLCGDTNPIHTCDAAAQIAGFQGRVVQGMLYAGLFPAIIGSHFVSSPTHQSSLVPTDANYSLVSQS